MNERRDQFHELQQRARLQLVLFLCLIAVAAVITYTGVGPHSGVMRREKSAAEPVAAAPFALTGIALGHAVRNGQLTDRVDGWTLTGTPAEMAIQWSYTGARIGGLFQCQFQPEGADAIAFADIRIEHVNGGAWCRHAFAEPGRYRLMLLLDGQQVWSQDLMVEPNAEPLPAEDLAQDEAPPAVPPQVMTRPSRSGRVVRAPSPPAVAYRSFKGRWQGYGMDEGYEWQIALDIDPDVAPGQSVGRSAYGFRPLTAGYGVCRGEMFLLEKSENRLVLREERLRELDVNCIGNAPYGEEITLEMQGDHVLARWIKRRRSQKVTMETSLYRQ